MHTILSLFHYAWSFALVISVIVFIHEGGHFIAARLCGVKVETFALGFGYELFGFTDRRGTRWKFAALPLGGYVKMYGDATAASNPDTDMLAQMTAEQKTYSLHHQPLWKKSIIVAAGPLANFLLTIVVFTYFIFTVGLSSTEPVVGEVMPNTPAATAGLQAGDRITQIDSTPIATFNDIPETIATNLYTPVTLQVVRGTSKLSLILTPIAFAEKDPTGNMQTHPLLGIRSQKLTYKNVGLPMALAAAVGKTYDMCATTLHFLGQIVTGHRSLTQMKSPLGIAKLSGDVTNQGATLNETLLTLLWFIAFLSANVGLTNLLPIPVLDGGHLVFYALEALRGRPLAERFKEYSFRAGFAFIAMIMAFTFYNDARQMFFKPASSQITAE